MASSIKKGMTLLRAPANSLAFAMRNRLRWRRGAPRLVDEPKQRLFDYLDPAAARRCESRHGELLAGYDLGGLHASSTRADYRENLYLLDCLDQLFAGEAALPQRSLQVVDVGAKNWNYVFALERFWRHWRCREGRRVTLAGYEIDGYGVYPDLRSRCDHAMAFVEQTANPLVSYEVADFTACPRRSVDVVTIFFPFLTRYALLQWGLPLSCFGPRRLVEHAVQILSPGGRLVVFNQTAHERDVLHGLLRELGVDIARSQPLRSRLLHYHHHTQERWATLVRAPSVTTPAPASATVARQSDLCDRSRSRMVGHRPGRSST